MKVPFVDLKAQYQSIKDEIREAIEQVLDATAFAGGPFVAGFEEHFAAFCGTKHAVAVGSGTEALWFALLGLGVGAGDEVITVPNTFIATAEAISFCGATPVFVDVEQTTYTMDPALLEKAITPRTRAIIPVHLFGQPANMDPIKEIAARHGLFVVEDACQAHGSEYRGRRAGSLGNAGCFSFYPGKNLGAYGEAGAVTTDDDGLAERIRVLRDHGQAKKYFHDRIGWNGRMDGIQGAVLSVKLKHLDAWNEARRKNAHLYTTLLSGVEGVRCPYEADYASHVYHIYACCVSDRETLIATLKDKGVDSGIHYPVPVHLQNAYAFLGCGKGSFPVAENVAQQLISLPMFAELNEEAIRHVCTEISSSLSGI